MEEEEDDRALAGKLFGTLRQRAATGGHVASAVRLRERQSNDPECAMACFCDGCGAIRALAELGVAEFAKFFGVPVPSPAADYFLRLDRCPQCGRGASSLQFVPIADATP